MSWVFINLNNILHLTRKTNKIFARLMDGGKMLTAEVRTVDYYFEKLQEVWIRIFLNDL
ncbi:hypothetical protein [Clostridium sp.]|uniref:hypothetical protein n=1 Tax=Clostridium sp. TaxID=1506 RepID=UPI003217FDE9